MAASVEGSEALLEDLACGRPCRSPGPSLADLFSPAAAATGAPEGQRLSAGDLAVWAECYAKGALRISTAGSPAAWVPPAPGASMASLALLAPSVRHSRSCPPMGSADSGIRMCAFFA